MDEIASSNFSLTLQKTEPKHFKAHVRLPLAVNDKQDIKTKQFVLG
jgi:hypothetical protein